MVAGLLGAVGFELLKLLLSGYLKGVASKSMYGAFGTPIALLLWINFTAKLLVFCAAWTATQDPAAEADERRPVEGPDGDGPEGGKPGKGAGEPEEGGGKPEEGGGKPKEGGGPTSRSIDRKR